MCGSFLFTKVEFACFFIWTLQCSGDRALLHCSSSSQCVSPSVLRASPCPSHFMKQRQKHSKQSNSQISKHSRRRVFVQALVWLPLCGFSFFSVSPPTVGRRFQSHGMLRSYFFITAVIIVMGLVFCFHRTSGLHRHRSVCECVCVWERERVNTEETNQNNDADYSCIVCVCVCVCVN